MTTEQRVQREPSLVKNGRLYFKDLELVHRIKLTAIDAQNGNPTEFTIVPVSIRDSADKSTRHITFLFEGTTDGSPFSFYKLGDQNEIYTIGVGSLIDNHVSGHLVNPYDCRDLNSEFIQSDTEWDMAFDLLRKKQILPIAAHNIINISVEQMTHPIKLPKTSGYVRSLAEARGV